MEGMRNFKLIDSKTSILGLFGSLLISDSELLPDREALS